MSIDTYGNGGGTVYNSGGWQVPRVLQQADGGGWGRRLNGQQGQVCEYIFDCFGILNCCKGIGNFNQNLCYPVCDRQKLEACSETERCAQGLTCCQGVCQYKPEGCINTPQQQLLDLINQQK